MTTTWERAWLSIDASIVMAQTEIIDIAQEQIGRLARELGVPEARWSVVMGNTKDEIVRAAAEGKMDLIVIGSRGRHGLAFLLKPTEDVVVHKAPCDVLAVRLPEEDHSKSKKKEVTCRPSIGMSFCCVR